MEKPETPACGDDRARELTDQGSRIDQNHLHPNHELTEEEKSQKRDLKRLLKRQKRRKKLETRLQQAIMRKDIATEESSRRDLERFMQEEENETLKTHSLLTHSELNAKSMTEEASQSYQDEAQARSDIEHLYQRYYKILMQQQKEEEDQMKNTNKDAPADNNNLDAYSLKEQQTAEARLLLLNMTKGTQQVHHFENQSALIGYTRQKFQERACLSISSLSKLDPRRLPPQQPAELERRVWNQLINVRSICSIGCGPGCDAVGSIQFLEQFATNGEKTQPTIDRVVFLDFVLDKWQFFLQPLIDQVLIPSNHLRTADIAFCDVLQPLSDASNAKAKGLLLNANETDQGESSIDLFVTSYLLTETRGQWIAFYSDLLALAKPGSLFLHAEPTAWQLHTLTKMATTLDFVWLDSSMHSRILQALEGRVAAAVLIGMKR